MGAIDDVRAVRGRIGLGVQSLLACSAKTTVSQCLPREIRMVISHESFSGDPVIHRRAPVLTAVHWKVRTEREDGHRANDR